MRRLVEEFPKTRIDVLAGINKIVFPMLLKGEVDVLCGEIEEDMPTYGLDVLPLLDAEQVIVIRAGHPLRDLPMTPASLAGCSFVLFQHDERLVNRLDRFMGGGAHRYQISVSTSSFATGLRLVAETDHLMIAPAQLQPVIAEAGLVLQWPEPRLWSLTTGIVARSSSRSIPMIERFISLVEDSTKEFPQAMAPRS